MPFRRTLSAALLLGCLCAASGHGGADVDPAVFPDRQVLSTDHFILRHENPFAPAGVLGLLEGLHAKLLLDLRDFAPWAEGEKIPILLYKDAASYARNERMPPWAGGHVDLNTRTISVYESDGLTRTLAHEMGHLFFDHYFKEKSTTPPLWLNEGVATRMEWDYGLAGEQVFRQQTLRERAGLPLEDFFRYSYQHAGAGSGREVALWYAQAASVVGFLMRRFSKDQFLRFCEAVRRGDEVDAALLGAYGLQMPDARALERLWREDLAK